ncbi:MAG: PTS system mannose/fructose/sorbose family transporter subunit IID [Oscillospiraceae bacterium]|nr:PTS system mannose/fructose/sorbose family transporter subunit IID [Oscillospiraceae bacterium]
MSEHKNVVKSNSKITKKDFKKVFLRNIFGLQWGWNYEKMQGLGYCYVIMPILRLLYGNNPEKLTKAMQVELGFFNTSQPMSNLIIGTGIALHEEVGIDKGEDAIVGLKSGLMGPFAGIGDTIFITIYRALVFSIAAYLALDGQVVPAMAIPIICGLLIIGVRWKFLFLAYDQGSKLASGLGSQLKRITEAASIVGLTVIGALVASVVNAPIGITLGAGEVAFSLQEMLDRILPRLLPLLLVLLSYWLLGKKKMTTTKLIIVLMILGIGIGVFNWWLS